MKTQITQSQSATEMQYKPKNIKGKYFLTILFAGLISSCGFFGGGSEPSMKLIPYKSGDMWGYIDREGKILINPQFQGASVFIDGIALVVSADEKYGYIGEDGKYKINPTYKSALPFSEGLACVVPENGKPQFIDKENNIKFTVTTGEICGSFNNELAVIQAEDKWGFIDKEGNIKINVQFDRVHPFCEGLAAVASINKDKGDVLWGFINDKGEIIINYQFKLCSSFSEGLAVVSDGKKYGYVDKNGKYVINPQYDAAGDFKNGRAKISQGSMYGYIDKEGKIIINPQFSQALNFSDDNDIALVWGSDGKAGYIDPEGKYLINPQFEKGTNFFGNIAFVRSADKWGIIDEDGKYLVNPQFDNINVESEIYKHATVHSDYFDMAGPIQKFLAGTDQNNFRGLNINSTYTQIVNAVGGKDKLDVNEHGNSANYRTDELLSKEVALSEVKYVFSQLIAEQKPIYKTVQRHDYWKGNYYAQEFDHYELILNDNALLKGVQYDLDFSGKAEEKKQVLMDALCDEIATKLGVKDKTTIGNIVEISNDEIKVSIDKYDGDVYFSFIKNEVAAEEEEEEEEAAAKAAAKLADHVCNDKCTADAHNFTW